MKASIHSDVNEAINKALEVASPESSTTQTGTTGVSTSARVDAPEEFKFAGERADSPSTFTSNRTAKTSPAMQPLPHGLIVNEHLALVTDEGANSSNAWRLHEHVQHGLDRLARRVEGVLLRAKVIEPELAEVRRA